MELFGTHIRTMSYIGSYHPLSPRGLIGVQLIKGETSLNITICWSFCSTFNKRFCALVCFVSLIKWR